tara:strand:+ start:7003 stop:7365 length:363 start_codon:yes stop_codon:yes gene_type:complete
MKTGLILKKNGEINEIKIKNTNFSLENDEFGEYKHYIKCNDYIILYNKLDKDLNIHIIPFTEYKFYGDILIIKINKGNDINNLTKDKYIKIISKIKIEENDMYYSSEDMSDIEDRPLFSF